MLLQKQIEQLRNKFVSFTVSSVFEKNAIIKFNALCFNRNRKKLDKTDWKFFDKNVKTDSSNFDA